MQKSKFSRDQLLNTEANGLFALEKYHLYHKKENNVRNIANSKPQNFKLPLINLPSKIVNNKEKLMLPKILTDNSTAPNQKELEIPTTSLDETKTKKKTDQITLPIISQRSKHMGIVSNSSIHSNNKNRIDLVRRPILKKLQAPLLSKQNANTLKSLSSEFENKLNNKLRFDEKRKTIRPKSVNFVKIDNKIRFFTNNIEMEENENNVILICFLDIQSILN